MTVNQILHVASDVDVKLWLSFENGAGRIITMEIFKYYHSDKYCHFDISDLFSVDFSDLFYIGLIHTVFIFDCSCNISPNWNVAHIFNAYAFKYIKCWSLNFKIKKNETLLYRMAFPKQKAEDHIHAMTAIHFIF